MQYILDDCDATAIVRARSAWRGAGRGAGRLRRSARAARRRLDVNLGELVGFGSYETAVGPHLIPRRSSTTSARAHEMLFITSGHHGEAEGGAARSCPSTLAGRSLEGTPVQIASRMGLSGAGPGAVYLSPAPLYHSRALVYCTSMLRLGGETVVVMEPVRRPGVPPAHRGAIGWHDAQFVPTMFTRLLALPPDERAKYDLSSLKYVLHRPRHALSRRSGRCSNGGVPIVHEYYGGTEDVGSTWITAQEWIEHPGSVGRPMEPAHIVGPDGTEVRLAMRGSSTSKADADSSTTTILTLSSR